MNEKQDDYAARLQRGRTGAAFLIRHPALQARWIQRLLKYMDRRIAAKQADQT